MTANVYLGFPDRAVFLFVLCFCLFVRCVSHMMTNLCLGSPDRAVETQSWCCCCARAVGAHLREHLISFQVFQTKNAAVMSKYYRVP